MPADLAFVSEITPGAIGIWTLVLIAFTHLIKTWPVWKQRVNEARAQQDLADGSLRADLMKRISELEERVLEEQRHCEDRLRDLGKRMDEKYEGLMHQFITAQRIWAQAIPPSERSPVAEQIRTGLLGLGDGQK